MTIQNTGKLDMIVNRPIKTQNKKVRHKMNGENLSKKSSGLPSKDMS